MKIPPPPADQELAPKASEQLSQYIDEWYNNHEERERETLKLPAAMGKLLAQRISDDVVPQGYVMATELLTYDCITGKDGFSGKPMPLSVSGYPPIMYDVSKLYLKEFARGAFGDQFSNEIDEIYKQIRG